MRHLAGWLAVAALLAGCLQADNGGDGPGPATPSDPPAAADVLAGLDLAVRPDGQRALADLEEFVALAPRRYENQFQHEAARGWLADAFAAAGLQVVRQDFMGTSQAAGLSGAVSDQVPGQNILGILPGRDPDRLLVFGAHYDSAITAYGAAYDDGSGTVILVELARAMAQHEWTHTLVFAQFDQEEAGLVGSAHAAQAFVDEGKQVDLMVNFDMAGINWPAKVGGVVDVPITAEFLLEGAVQNAALWTQVVEHLGHPAASNSVESMANATSAPSDHGSFVAAGVPSAWVHGSLIGNYPAYHTADTVETMIADVGGDRAALEAGFDAILLRTFVFAFLADQGAA